MTDLFAVTVHVYGFNGIDNPLNPPFLMGTLTKSALGGKGAVILHVFRAG